MNLWCAKLILERQISQWRLRFITTDRKKDQYNTYFGALKTTYKASPTLTLKLIGSLFHTTEKEHFDILAQYRLGM